MRNKTFGLFSLTFGLFLTFLTAACGRDEIPSLPAPPENDSTHQEIDRPGIPAGAQTFSYTDPALWQGDTAHFRWGTAPDGYPTLTLDAPQAGISYLSAPSAVYLRGARWDLRFQINGKTPGRKSHARFYLASDRADLRQPLHGYFLALGICNPSLTGDPSGQYLALCRQDGLPEDTTVIFDCHSEMFLTGYLIRDQLAQLAEAVPDGPALTALREKARALSLGLVVGMPVANPGGKPYNALVMVDRDGSVAGAL